MKQLTEPYLQDYGNALWTELVAPIWKLHREPPQIWYVKSPKYFKRRYRDFLNANCPGIENYAMTSPPNSCATACIVNHNTLERYHDPISVIMKIGILKDRKDFGDEELSVLHALSHELSEAAFLFVNPSIPGHEAIYLNEIGIKHPFHMMELVIFDTIHHSFVYESTMEVLNRKGYDGKQALTKYQKAKIAREQRNPIEMVFEHKSYSRPLLGSVLMLEVLSSLEPSIDSLRERAEKQELKISEEEYERYFSLLKLGMAKLGYEIRMLKKDISS